MTPTFQSGEQNHLGPKANGALHPLYLLTMQLFVRFAFIPARANQSSPIQVGLLPLVLIIALRPYESIVQRCDSKQQEGYFYYKSIAILYIKCQKAKKHKQITS